MYKPNFSSNLILSTGVLVDAQGKNTLNCPLNVIEVKPSVGCAYAIIMGWLTGREPSCDCSDNNSSGSVK